MSFLAISKKEDYTPVKPYYILVLKKNFNIGLDIPYTLYKTDKPYNYYRYVFNCHRLVFNPRIYTFSTLKSIKKYSKKLYVEVIKKFPKQFKFKRNF